MAKHAHEFQCDHDCGWYNYPMLDDTMNGNYTIICGHCGHHHHRTIKNGVVTADRHSENEKTHDTIHVMPSACSKEKRKLGLIAQFRQKEAAGLAK